MKWFERRTTETKWCTTEGRVAAMISEGGGNDFLQSFYQQRSDKLQTERMYCSKRAISIFVKLKKNLHSIFLSNLHNFNETNRSLQLIRRKFMPRKENVLETRLRVKSIFWRESVRFILSCNLCFIIRKYARVCANNLRERRDTMYSFFFLIIYFDSNSV